MASDIPVAVEPAESACSTCCGDNFDDISSSSLDRLGSEKGNCGDRLVSSRGVGRGQRKRCAAELDASSSDTGSGREASDCDEPKRRCPVAGDARGLQRERAEMQRRMRCLLKEREQLQQANSLLCSELMKYRKALLLQAQENTSLRSHISILAGGKSSLSSLGVGQAVKVKPVAQASNRQAEAVAAAALAKAGNNPVEALRILIRLASPTKLK